ncbi:hypothetical protein D3C85_1224070 [compost metagenome]
MVWKPTMAEKRRKYLTRLKNPWRFSDHRMSIMLTPQVKKLRLVIKEALLTITIILLPVQKMRYLEKL